MNRLVKGVAAAAVAGAVFASPVNAGAVTPKKFTKSFTLFSPGDSVTIPGRISGPGKAIISFKDVGIFGDSFRATYTDAFTPPIVGKCSVSSLSSFKKSLTVIIPSARSYSITVTWCSGPAVFPAGGIMQVKP